MQFHVEFAGVETTCGALSSAIACSGTDVFMPETSCNSLTSCNAATCCVSFCSVPSNNGLACNDNNPATIGDACTAGACVGTQATCSNTGVTCSTGFVRKDSSICTPGVDCTAQACCVSFCSVPSNNGLTCNDNNAATTNDRCTNGVCVGTQAQTLSVSSLVVRFVLNAQNKYVYQATATVKNQANVVVDSVAVTGRFRIANTDYAAQSANTNASGVAVMSTSNTWGRLNQKDAAARFCVTNLVLAGYAYTAGTVCATVQ
jgi:hypothetical protein